LQAVITQIVVKRGVDKFPIAPVALRMNTHDGGTGGKLLRADSGRQLTHVIQLAGDVKT
jgi:hypothetical protein